MQYANLGRSGLKVSRICLGMMSYGDRTSRAWHLDEDAARPIDAQRGADLLADWKQRGVSVVTTADVIAGRV